jgi:hypothetical protein
MSLPPVQSRKRGKCMSRRTGQNPKVRVKKRSNGQKVFYFQYWIDVPGQEDRRRKTHVIGPTRKMTKSEAERKKVEFLLNLELNSMEYQIPSSLGEARNEANHDSGETPHGRRRNRCGTIALRLIVERLKLCDYFLRVCFVYLQKPSASTPGPL